MAFIHRHSPFMSSGRLPRSTSTGPSISVAARAAGGTRSADKSSAMKDEQSLILEGIPDAKEVYRLNEYRLFWEAPNGATLDLILTVQDARVALGPHHR